MASRVELEREAREHLETTAKLATALVEGDFPGEVAGAAQLLRESLVRGGKVLFCGNGGSAADAQHLAAELVGRIDAAREGHPLAGIALTTDTSILTAVANDFGYQEVFARQVRALGRTGDALVCLSTSGHSDNVIEAARVASSIGIPVVSLVGPGPSPLEEFSEVCLHLPGETSGQIQQGHIAVGHALCALVDSARPA
ncbi:MAG TPA: SIS domain-containing protein [Actinomycetota bacterium]|nr:SIS domain-containing protein [Actinomycetota bacterium]